MPSYAAAIAYHAIISLAPILLFAIALASRMFGADTAAQQVVSTMQHFAGTAVASVVAEIIEENALNTRSNVLFSLAAVLITLYSASNVFRQLVIALNAVWEIEPPSIRIQDGIIRWGLVRLRKYFMGLVLTLVIIFSLLASLVVNVLAGYFAAFLNELIPGVTELLVLFNLLALPVILTLFCLVIFKVLPNDDVAWRDVWLGALLTGIVLSIGQGLIGFYASRSRIPDYYGVAGSVVILMLWAYFSAYILLLGAEFTHVYARRYGSYATQGPQAKSVVDPN